MPANPVPRAPGRDDGQTDVQGIEDAVTDPEQAFGIRVFPEEEVDFGVVAKSENASSKVEILKTEAGSNLLLFSVRIKGPERTQQQHSRQTR
jgi:hypothetical protein